MPTFMWCSSGHPPICRPRMSHWTDASRVNRYKNILESAYQGKLSWENPVHITLYRRRISSLLLVLASNELPFNGRERVKITTWRSLCQSTGRLKHIHTLFHCTRWTQERLETNMEHTNISYWRKNLSLIHIWFSNAHIHLCTFKVWFNTFWSGPTIPSSKFENIVNA